MVLTTVGRLRLASVGVADGDLVLTTTGVLGLLGSFECCSIDWTIYKEKAFKINITTDEISLMTPVLYSMYSMRG